MLRIRPSQQCGQRADYSVFLRIAFLSAMILLLVTFVSGADATVTNYVTNGSFETDTAGWSLTNGSAGSITRSNALSAPSGGGSFALMADSGTSRRTVVTQTADYAFTYNGGATSATLNHYFRKALNGSAAATTNTISIYLSGPNDGGAFGSTQLVWQHTGTAAVNWGASATSTNVLSRLNAGGNGSWTLRITVAQNNDNSSGSVRAAVDLISLDIDIPQTTTVGEAPSGQKPINKTLARNSTNKAVDAFTLATDSGNDTVTSVTVTGTNSSNVASNGAKLWLDNGTTAGEWDAGDTQVGSSTSFSGSTATFSGLSISATTTATRYIVTYDISGTATHGATLTGYVTSITSSNSKIYSDTADATLTVDAQAPTTTFQTTPDASPTGSNGWYKTPESVLLSRDEPGYTGYKWNAGGTWTSYSGSFAAPEGQNTLYFQSTDDVGNVENMKTQDVKIDTGVPSSTIITPTEGSRLRGNSYTITGTASESGDSGVAKVEVQIDGGAWTQATGTTSWSYNWTLPADGAHTIKSRATDNAGNVETPGAGVGVTVDNTAPTIQTRSPSDGAMGVSVSTTVQATFSEDMSADTIDTSNFTLKQGSNPVPGTVTYNTSTRTATFTPSSNLAAGTTYTATVTTEAKDLAGNGLSTNDSWSFTTVSGPDTDPPITTLVTNPSTADGSSGWFISTPDITLTRNEPGTSYYQWDGTGDASWNTYSSTFDAISGQHTLHYRSVDTAGNTEDAKSQAFKVDTVKATNPTLSSTSHNTSDTSADNTIDMSWSGASDSNSGLDGFSYEFDTAAISTPDTVKDAEETTSSATSSALTSGTWYFHLRTRDNAGNWSDPVHFGPITIDVTAPITITSTNPSSPNGTNGWFTSLPLITLSANEGGTIQYQWDGTSGPWVTYSAPFNALSGNHTLYYRAIDAFGNTEDVKSSVIKVDAPASGGEIPTDPTSVSSDTHTIGVPSSNQVIHINFSGASDATSGIAGYSVEWTVEATTLPDQSIDLPANATGATSPPLATGNWYFHLRTRDNAGNWTSTVHLGPFPVNGPDISAGPHGGFNSATSKCRNCHRPHQAPGYRLIFAREGSYSTIAGFCFTCHKDGAGANNDVYGGIFRGTFTGTQDAQGNPLYDIENTSTYGAANAGLNGGGFVYARPYTGLGNRTDATKDVTSRHDVWGVPGVTQDQVTMWGSTTTGPGSTVVLWCVSCHIPHGSSNYRLLRDKLTPSGGRSFPANTVKSHEIAFDTNPATGNLTRSYTTVSYWQGITRFCTSCHLQYSTPAGRLDDSNGTYNSGDGFGAIKRYRHPVDVPLSNWTWPGYDNWGNPNGNIANNLNDPDHIMVPLEQDAYGTTADSSNRVVCLTCHQAHGSAAATVDAFSRAGPTTTAVSSGPGYSNLLRLDYRGVCENCHDWWHSPSNSNAE